jgi:hypothetical protein
MDTQWEVSMGQSVSSKRSRKPLTIGGDSEQLAREITRLSALDVPALRQSWAALFGDDPSTNFGRALLIRAIAYRLQEKAMPGLKPATQRLLDRIEQVQLSCESLHLSLKLPLAITEPSDVASPANLLLSRLVPMQMKRRGVEMRIVLEGTSAPNPVDLPLLKAVARARRWADELVSGKVQSVGELARREGLDGRSVRRLIPLGFLAPRIVEAIAEGRQPVDFTLEALTRRIDLPLLWSAQEQALGIE